MESSAKIIELLNSVLSAEITAINQYFVHSRMCANWGYDRLARHDYDESIDEMKDAQRLIERILFLDGVPDLQRLAGVQIGQTVTEQFRLDLDVERGAITSLNDGIARCREEGDNGTRALLEDLLQGEEEHADWLETQLHLIDQLGERDYLAQQLHG